MSENARIEELRRRVQSDPTSIAFAALAEEYRRAGRFEEAIEVCRNGLTRHPAYISARVTLGRALLESNKIDEAAAELEQVLKIAPENLTATRALSEIAARRSGMPAGTPGPAPAPEPKGGFEQDLMAGLARVGVSRPAPAPIPLSRSLQKLEAPAPTVALASTAGGVVERLQHFLEGIRAARAPRSDRLARIIHERSRVRS